MVAANQFDSVNREIELSKIIIELQYIEVTMLG